MKRLLYIISTILLVSCIREVQEGGVQHGVEVGAPVSLNFDVMFSGQTPATRLDSNASDDINDIFIIVFDENGYFTEYVEAEIGNEVSHGPHSYEKELSATLSQTDRPRRIHFIANCPIDQIQYGHEADVIGNMTVSGGACSYWGMIKVSAVMDENNDRKLDEFTDCIPLVRNFAEICIAVEKNEYTTNFNVVSWYLYNDIDKGTVAPYNMYSHSFQKFTDDSGIQLDYDVLLDTYGYEGHAVSDVTLNPAPTDETGFIPDTDSWHMYERKISARTEDEQSWLESPNHILIKGTYDGETTYYKVDLVRMVGSTDGTEISQYYNILRNFKYTFTINNVHSDGYDTLAEAIANPAGNNLSGSVDTQGLVNLSDGSGRIFVSYTDTTLVSGDKITLRYRFVPNIQDEPDVEANDDVHFHDIDGGSVIETYSNGTDDDTDGWRTLTIDPYEPSIQTKQQTILLHHTNANLTREITFTLRRPYTMNVICNPNEVESKVGSNFKVSFSIPDDLPEYMFPLDFAIEADEMSISPIAPTYQTNGSHIDQQLPVMNGESNIPGKSSQVFYYLKTLTWEAYAELNAANDVKTVEMDFQTNKANATSKVYVTNKYFSPAYDWIYTSGSTVIENVTINFSWQTILGATQTIRVYNASGVEVADPMTITTGSTTVTMVLYGVVDESEMLYFKFTTTDGDTYVATNTLNQVKSGQTLNFNKE